MRNCKLMPKRSYQTFIDTHVAVEPETIARSGRTVLRAEGKSITLAGADQRLTDAGKYFYRQTGKTFDRLFDSSLPLERDIGSGKEFVKMRNGKTRLARSWDAGVSDFKYTQLGKNYFKSRGSTEEWVLHIPVRITGRNSKGVMYTRMGVVPHSSVIAEPLKVPLAMSREEKHEALKAMVLEQVNQEALLEVSDESYRYDNAGAWQFSKLTTRVVDGEVTTDVVLRRPLSSATPLSMSFLSYECDLSALEPSDNCVVHQLCAQFGVDKLQTEELMTEIQSEVHKVNDPYDGQHWSLKGITATMLLEWCRRTRRNAYILWGNSLIQSYIHPAKTNHHCLCAAIWGDHLYSYSDPDAKRAVSRMEVKEPMKRHTEVLAKPPQPLADSIDEFEEFASIQPGKWWTAQEEMDSIKHNCILAGHVPKLRMRSFLDCSTIELSGSRPMIVKALPKNHRQLRDVAAHLSFLKGKVVTDYHGEGMARFTIQCLAALVRGDRVPINCTSAKCDNCGAPGPLHKDHTVPSSLMGTQGQNLCPPCHDDKTRHEDAANRHCRASTLNPMVSHLNPHAWKTFMESHPKQIVRRIHAPTKEKGVLVDIKRCRRSALTSGVAIPVFSCMDDPKAFELDDLPTADFFFLDHVRGSLQFMLPYTGSRWYHRICVQWLLHNNKIKHKHILFSFTASGHLAENAFVEPLQSLDKAWNSAGGNSKECVNAAIGMMGCRENCVYSATLSTVAQDGAMLCGRVAEQNVAGVTQWVQKTKLLETWTMYPIYAFCLDYERLQLAIIQKKALSLGVPKHSIIEFRTDSCLFEGSASLVKEFDQYHASSCSIGSAPLTQFDPTSTSSPPDINYSWNIVVEDPNGDASSSAREIVLEKGESLLLTGPGGTGKSFLVGELVKELRARGENVTTCALTHVAARVIGGCTLQSFVYRHIIHGSYKGWLVIDEISLLGTNLLNYVAMLLKAPVKMIMLGDFQQLPPILDSWCGKILAQNGFNSSRLLHDLAGGNLIRLTKCRRSCGELFHFYTSLYPGGGYSHMALSSQVELAKRTFPPIKGAARYNLCISHGKRKEINRSAWYAFQHGETLTVDFGNEEVMNEIFAGCPMMGNVNDKHGKGIINGAMYTVQSWDDTHIMLWDEDLQIEVKIPLAATRHMRLGWAITYAAIQSRTLRQHVRLWDCTHRCFTVKHLSMGLGRAISPRLVDLA